ncbi:carboxylic ester hydrolase [Lentzea sp. NBRC 105346]|uniref:carboxylesterase/lipase family protein n=1 Tax=Lentzea sp. NBRC 105346 TaxID=3032205 RepID=UPI0024A3169F|nr:carboxylesterase family protein [Lentzea sp. NBRC 105346]GLZ28361.1 carboxylic ester hydrolase [Lentzea sp. NBRC 105346]
MRAPLIAVLVAGLLTVPARADTGDVVRIDTGAVRGTVTASYRTFQKIPYAAPPVGALRWRDPQPPAAWSGVRDATKPGPICAQAGWPGAPSSTEEDCLHLNVTTPAKPGVKRPVMVFVHGGGFTTGSANEYDARTLAPRAGAVVVTINYRLGAFGYFGYPGLTGSGAFGLADQQAALRWVRRNAAAFGGDPGNVTLFGESAGGLSVCAQLTTPRTTGLFHKAIIQSGACQTSFAEPGGGKWTFWAPREEIERLGATTDLGCHDLACLRALPAQRLVDVAETFNRPAYGTGALPFDPIRALRDGWFHRVPVLLGTTHDEHTVFTAFDYPDPMDAAGFRSELTTLFGAKASTIEARYPLDGDGDARPELAAVLTDRTWACPAAQARTQLARRTSVFGYEYADAEAPLMFDGPPFPYRAYHGSELVSLFDFKLPLTPAQQRLAEYMTAAWARFTRTGDPGWRHSDVQSLAPGAIRTVNFGSEHRCGVWSDML